MDCLVLAAPAAVPAASVGHRCDFGAACADHGLLWYQWLGLAASPLFYLILFLAVLGIAVALTRASITLNALSSVFAFCSCRLPSRITRRITCRMLQQLPSLMPGLADPSGRGWQLPPFRYSPAAPLPMSIVWHLQVAVLLGGHVAGVYLAHLAALGVFPTRGRASAASCRCSS